MLSMNTTSTRADGIGWRSMSQLGRLLMQETLLDVRLAADPWTSRRIRLTTTQNGVRSIRLANATAGCMVLLSICSHCGLSIVGAVSPSHLSSSCPSTDNAISWRNHHEETCNRQVRCTIEHDMLGFARNAKMRYEWFRPWPP